MSEDTATGRTAERMRLGREVAATFLVSVVLTGALGALQDALPSIAAYVYLLVVLVFLALPTQVVRRFRGEDPIAAGMVYGLAGRGLVWGGLAALLVAVPFAAGYHLWSTWVWERGSEFAWENYERWPLELEGPPESTSLDDDAVHLWSQDGRLHVAWRAAVPIEARFTARAPTETLTAAVSVRNGARSRRGDEVVVSGPQDAQRGWTTVIVERNGPTPIVVEARQRGEFVPTDKLLLGAGYPAEENPLALSRGWLWLLGLLLTQLVLVGLPEEYFYRGYVQPTLERVLGTSWGQSKPARWWTISPAIVVASVLFALGHLLVGWHAARLAVFFPSLAFGWLRVRTGGLVAPILFHGLCNTMVELAAVHYWV